jgi:hypothetical protein
MKVNKKFVAYPVAMAVALAVGTASAQTTSNATLSAEGQALGGTFGSGDVYSKQGHALRSVQGKAQRLPVMTVTLADDYALEDEILLTISGSGVTPNIDRDATTSALDNANSIVCTVPTAGTFRITHPDQYIEPVGSAVTSTIRLRVTQRDTSIPSTVGAQCVIEGIHVTDASIATASLTAATSSQATILADWDAYDGTYVIGRPEGNDPATSNVKIDDLVAPVVVAVIRNQFEPYAVIKEWDGVVDVQVAGAQYTRFMANSPPAFTATTYSNTDVLQITSRDRGAGPVGTTVAANVYAGGQQNYFDGAVVTGATFDISIAGDFNFVRDSATSGGDATALPSGCSTAAVVTGGNSSVVGTENGAGTGTTSSNTGCTTLAYTYGRAAGVFESTSFGNVLVTHTLTATRGNSSSPWFVRQDFPVTSAFYNYSSYASVGSKGADPLANTDSTLDTTASPKAGTTTAASYDAGSDDPGAWTINGTRVFVPYMPFDTGITRILRVSNIMATDGDNLDPVLSVFDTADTGGTVGKPTTDSRVGRTAWAAGTPTEDGAVVLYQVWNAFGATCTFDGTTKALANATTNLALDFRNGVQGCGNILSAGAGTVSAMITIGAPEQGIEVVSAYNVNGDRVQVINNSNGRNNSESNAELGTRRPSGRSDYKQSEDLDDSNTL